MSSYKCAAEGCNAAENKRGKYGFMSGVRFFPFPSEKKDKKARKKWLNLLRRSDYEPKRWHRVCSLHFVDGEPTLQHPYPELFAYNNYKCSEAHRSTSSITKRSHSQHTDTPPHELVDTDDVGMEHDYLLNEGSREKFPHPVVQESTVISMDVHTTPAIHAIMDDHDYITSMVKSKGVVTHKDMNVQTDLTMEDMRRQEKLYKERENLMEDPDRLKRELFVNKITESDSSVRQYLGVSSLLTLFGLFAILDKLSPSLKYWRGSKGTQHQAAYQEDGSKKKTGPKRKLSRFHEFLITLLRIRLALPTFILADLFGISKSRVSQIFTTWLQYMYFIFSPLLKWPRSERIKKFLPKSFKLYFPKTTCIIDCTEFFIEKPSTPTAQIQTYSSYKHRNTFKALVSITPTGAFSFVSNLWGGNVSDRYITEHSGFLDSIRAGDEVMADRGFLIRDLLLERKATLNIPPFTRKCSWGKGKRLSSHDIKKTKNIARLRIHVERAIGRLKNYKMLSNTMPLTLKPLSNQILKVCAFLCNLQKPLVKK